MDCFIKENEKAMEWRFTLIYGEPVVANRKETWDPIRRLNNIPSMPWVIGGDFNEILEAHEKTGAQWTAWQMEGFRFTLNDCKLQDLGFTSYQFTWSNGRKGVNNVQKRLVRFVANDEWVNQCTNAQVKHAFSSHSDHSTIVLDTACNNTQQEEKHLERVFCFERMWADHDDCTRVIEKG